MPSLDASVIRFLWSVVEKHSHHILGLSDDDAIASWLGRQVGERIRLSAKEVELINSYIGDRLTLIRTIAESCHVS